VLPTVISDEIVMDFKADRISDFMIYYLSQKTDTYEKYMHIPLTKASTNITDCMPWMVCCFPLSLSFCNSRVPGVARAVTALWHHRVVDLRISE